MSVSLSQDLTVITIDYTIISDYDTKLLVSKAISHDDNVIVTLKFKSVVS